MQPESHICRQHFVSFLHAYTKSIIATRYVRSEDANHGIQGISNDVDALRAVNVHKPLCIQGEQRDLPNSSVGVFRNRHLGKHRLYRYGEYANMFLYKRENIAFEIFNRSHPSSVLHNSNFSAQLNYVVCPQLVSVCRSIDPQRAFLPAIIQRAPHPTARPLL